MYEDFYGLQAKPFLLTPDPRFFFLSSGHKRAMSYMSYGLSQGEGFIVVTGDIGTGKTTLVKSLFADLDHDKIIAAQLVTTQVDESDLLRLVSAAFGLPFSGMEKAELLTQFESFLQAASEQGKRVLLVVDEAQNLPLRSLEELRMLSNYNFQGDPVLQSFLLGQQEFRITLQSPKLEQLRQRVIASCDLRPLKSEETKEYILHRLRTVGWIDNPALSDDVFVALHKYSGGVPRRLNLLADRVLLFGFFEEIHQLTGSQVEEVAAELNEELSSLSIGKNSESAELNNSLLHDRDSDLERRVAKLEEAITVIRQGLSEQVRQLGRSLD